MPNKWHIKQHNLDKSKEEPISIHLSLKLIVTLPPLRTKLNILADKLSSIAIGYLVYLAGCDGKLE